MAPSVPCFVLSPSRVDNKTASILLLLLLQSLFFEELLLLIDEDLIDVEVVIVVDIAYVRSLHNSNWLLLLLRKDRRRSKVSFHR